MNSILALAFVLLGADIYHWQPEIPDCAVRATSVQRAYLLHAAHPVSGKPIAVICADGRAWSRYGYPVGRAKLEKMLGRMLDADGGNDTVTTYYLVRLMPTIRRQVSSGG